jgi:hypothetical protein
MCHPLLRTPIAISLILFLALLFLSTKSVAQIRLAWDPNTEPDVAGYQIYYGTASRSYGYSIDVGNVTTYTLLDLTQGVTYYIALTAYDSANNKSDYSNEVSGTVTETISPPNVLNGPTSGTPGQPCTYTTGGSSSTLGHSLQYQFDWRGDATSLSPWGSATQPNTWTSPGTFNVRARARCAIHTSVISSWTGPISVAISQATLPVNVATKEHVGDLESTSQNSATNKWTANVTIEVHDANERPVASATVSGRWSGGYIGSRTCVTDARGRCTVSSGSIGIRKATTTFTVRKVTHTTLSYDVSSNHDIDGDSNGTFIIVSKPQ